MAEREAKSDDSSKPDAESSDTKPKKDKSRATKEAHAAVLQADLDKLEARLKRADTLTRNSVESLETIVDALEMRLKTHKSSQKGQLTRQINALSAKLDDTISNTRDAIRQDLRKALAQGAKDSKSSLSVLDAAIKRSAGRIDEAELAQADAITRINRHMADMARAVDMRIEEETKARRQDITGVQQRLDRAKSELETRVGTIERDSANALLKVGEKIEVLHDRLESRRDSDTDAVALKVKSLARQTEADFEAYRERLETRILELETRQDMLTVRSVGKEESEAEKERDRQARAALNAQLVALQRRIDTMEEEQRRSEASARAALAKAESVASMPNANFSPAPDAPLTLTQISRIQGQEQASPTPPPGQASQSPSKQGAGDHVPVEFNPYADNGQSSQTNIVHFGQSESPLAPTPPAEPPLPPRQQPPVFENLQTHQSAPNGLGHPPSGDLDGFNPQSPSDPFEPAPLPDAPYSNPAYAEGDEGFSVSDLDHDDGSPKAVRIADGDQTERRRKLPNLTSGMTGKTLRNALLVTGVAVAGVITARMVLGTNDVPLPNNARDIQSPITGSNSPSGTTPSTIAGNTPNSVSPADTTIPPIGDYVEENPIEINPDQIDTLEAAVDAGNPVAQFQMGIAKVEGGETQEGASLIREASDAGEPFAQYRLAKLHEAGLGVEQSDTRARQLIEQAARSGHRIAMHDLALYYAEGRGGVSVDMAAAQSWFEQAAQRGVLDSQYNLAVLSEAPDTGLIPEPEEAYFWYSVAARKGDQFAVARRDVLAGTFEAEKLAELNARVDNFSPQEIDKRANGIFEDLPWLSNSPNAQGDAENQVLNAQILLAELGFDVGGADGLMGQKTRTAIMAFERANGLPQTGRINSELLSRLERAAGV